MPMNGGGKEKKPLLKLWTRDKGICGLCGLPVPFRQATRDHVITTNEGGGNGWDNLILAHDTCNHRRGAISLARYKEILAMRPLNHMGLPKFTPEIRQLLKAEHRKINEERMRTL